ncbi:phosphoribosyltransferase family protein [Anaerovoracaceae bacterium 41-7]
MIKLNDIVIEQNHFPDKTLNIKLPEKWDRYFFFYEGPPKIVISWYYENDSELFTIICLTKQIKSSRPNSCIELFLPYVPHARMDRTKNENDIFTLKYFCEVINSLEFESVKVFDPHSDVVTALINNCRVNIITNDILETFYPIDSPNLLLFYPDNGAEKKYGSTIKKNYTFGIKHRDWITGKIESYRIADPDKVKGRDILIVDDICSYGGTFALAAKALKEAGARSVRLYVSHCEKNIFKGKIFEEGNIDRVYTTNSLLRAEDVENDKITVIELVL